jgi:alkaline phosphatase D
MEKKQTMRMTRRLTLFLAICTIGSTAAMSAESKPATRNVVLITADGVRWQEVFRGAEETLLNEKDGGVADAVSLRRDFWRATPEARREALMPFLWSEVARHGQIYGNRDKASPARVANGMNFVQSRPECRGSTTLIVTADHGRGDPPRGWRDHGTKTPGSEAIWMTVIGPDTPSLGERTNIGMVTQGQVAATVAALLGEDYLADVPNAARPIADMIAPAAKTVEVPAVEPLRRIAFGSCATQARPQPIWDAVVATRPELTLLLGDNIYADTLDMNVMRAKYARFAAMPGFQSLRKTCPILATWDDHDLGLNDAGGDYPKKDESQKIFLDFFGDPDDSPRRHRPGVYDAKVFGPAGKRVQVILLDTRYFRSALKRKAGPRNPSDPYEGNTDPTTTILGEAQWRWLGEQLRVPAEVRLLVSSIQVVAEDHGFEKWMNFPHERERLFRLIRDTGADGVIILSGDRHLAELSMMDAQVGYPIYDVTASGFNQASRSWRPFETNRHRVATMNWGDNFGVVNIDWDQPDPRISMQIRDVDGDITIQQKIRLSTIRRKTLRPRQEVSAKP